MIRIPYEQIIEKIKEKSGLSDDEINIKIKQKLEQLSGLISKDGAAHILANELGVVLFKTSGRIKIKEVLEGMRSLEAVGKVVRVFDVREFESGERKGKVGSFIIGDETGTIRVVCWHKQTEVLEQLKEDDIVKVMNCYVKNNNGVLEIHMNERAKLLINPSGETVKEVKQTERPTAQANRKKISDLKENEQNVEVFGTIVQVMEPRFFDICPTCRKKAVQQEDKFVCNEHGEIPAEHSYVFNIFLDDGSDNIRVVLYKNQMEHLLEKTQEQILEIKEHPEKFEGIKHSLIGEQVKFVGRVNKNQMFDRIEFIANQVFLNPSPEEEIEKIKTETVT